MTKGQFYTTHIARLHVFFGAWWAVLWLVTTYVLVTARFLNGEPLNLRGGLILGAFWLVFSWTNWVGIRAIICCKLNKWPIW